jgi:hypothetical protein
MRCRGTCGRKASISEAVGSEIGRMDGSMTEKTLAPQLAQVREAVKQFPGSNVRRLSALTWIPRKTFHRRLIELERLGLVACGANDGYYVIPIHPSDFPPLQIDQP